MHKVHEHFNEFRHNKIERRKANCEESSQDDFFFESLKNVFERSMRDIGPFAFDLGEEGETRRSKC